MFKLTLNLSFRLPMRLKLLKNHSIFYFLYPVVFFIVLHLLTLSMIGPIRYDGTINMSYISEKFFRK